MKNKFIYLIAVFILCLVFWQDHYSIGYALRYNNQSTDTELVSLLSDGSTLTLMSVSENVAVLTRSKHRLWMAAPLSNDGMGSMILGYDLYSNRINSRIQIRGLAPHRIYEVNNWLIVGVYHSDKMESPFRSSIEIYQRSDDAYQYVSSIYLQNGHRFQEDQIALTSDQKTLYVLAEDYSDPATFGAPYLYEFDVGEEEVSLTQVQSLRPHVGTPGGLTVNNVSLFVSSFYRYPGPSPNSSEEEYSRMDDRVVVLNREDWSRIHEIKLDKEFPTQLLFNHETATLFVSHRKADNPGLSIIKNGSKPVFISELSVLDMTIFKIKQIAFIAQDDYDQTRLMIMDAHNFQFSEQYLGQYRTLAK